MNSEKPILSIVIPTYNRKIFLEECLQHVILQIEDGVEVIVCDNASTDDTYEFMHEYCKKYSFIRYLRNERNIGPDGNFLRCLKEGKGQYIHLLSDDDILLDGSVRKIKECILNFGEISFIYLNVKVFENEYEIKKCGDALFNEGKDILFTNKNLFVEQLGIFATFVSAMIFNKKIFNKINNPEQYLGTNLLQTHILFNVVAIKQRAILISNPCIAARDGNNGRLNLYKVFAHNWKKVLFDTGIKKGYKKKSLKNIYSSTIKFFLRGWIIRMKTKNTNFESTGYGLLFKETYKYPVAWIYLYPIILMPPYLIKILYKAYKQVRRVSK